MYSILFLISNSHVTVNHVNNTDNQYCRLKNDKSNDLVHSTDYKRNIQNHEDDKNKKTIIMYAINICDHDPNAPLLPPDKITIAGNLYDCKDPMIARAWYNESIKKDYNSNKTKRSYVIGSYHSSLFNKKQSNTIDWNDTGNIDIRCILNCGVITNIKIRKCPEILSDSIMKLHYRLKTELPNSSRHKYGDGGKMYVMGRKDSIDGYKFCENNDDICEMISDVGKKRKEWFLKMFPEDYIDNFKTPVDIKYMNSGLSNLMIHSTELCNASHYDSNDDSVTISTWVEEIHNNTDNWYLVFPNVSCDNGKKSTIIQLFHGCTVLWDARVLRHASSQVIYRIRGGGGRSAGNCELRRKPKSKK